MKNNNNNNAYKSIQINADTDYYLELHNLLTKKNMMLINKISGQKLENVVLVKELYSFVYFDAYTEKFSDNIRKKMSSKITIKKAKELCEFINSVGITKDGVDTTKKVFYDKDTINNLQNNNKNTRRTTEEVFKNNKEGLSKLTAETKKIDLKELMKEKRQSYKKESEYEKENINKFVMRKTKDEKAIVDKEEKPKFIKQINQVKKSKISINTFPFNEDDDINIKKDGGNEETIVELKKELHAKRLISNADDKDKIIKQQIDNNVVANRKVIDADKNIVKSEIVYDYKEVDESKNKTKKKSKQKDSPDENNTSND